MTTIKTARAAALALLLTIATASAQNQQDQSLVPAVPVLTVTGVGTLEAPADEVTITLSVVTEGDEDESVRDVTNENSRKVRRVIEALADAGADKDDIETSRFNVQPTYNRPPRGTAPRIVGYRVENAITITTKNLDRAPGFIQGALQAGANRVASVNYGLADERAKRAEVIKEAAQNARADAEALAAASGVRLKRVLRIDLDQPQFNRPQPMFRAEMARAVAEDASTPPPLEAGDIQVSATVTMVFEIGQEGDERAEVDPDKAFEAMRADEARRRARRVTPPEDGGDQNIR